MLDSYTRQQSADWHGRPEDYALGFGLGALFLPFERYLVIITGIAFTAAGLALVASALAFGYAATPNPGPRLIQNQLVPAPTVIDGGSALSDSLTQTQARFLPPVPAHPSLTAAIGASPLQASGTPGATAETTLASTLLPQAAIVPAVAAQAAQPGPAAASTTGNITVGTSPGPSAAAPAAPAVAFSPLTGLVASAPAVPAAPAAVLPVQAPAVATAVPVIAKASVASDSLVVKQRINNVNLTFYDCLGQNFCDAMYNGRKVYEGAVACSWNLPIGTKLVIVGDPTRRIYICEDRGLLTNTWVDVFWFDPRDGYRWQASVGRWGTVEVVDLPGR